MNRRLDSLFHNSTSHDSSEPPHCSKPASRDSSARLIVQNPTSHDSSARHIVNKSHESRLIGSIQLFEHHTSRLDSTQYQNAPRPTRRVRTTRFRVVRVVRDVHFFLNSISVGSCIKNRAHWALAHKQPFRNLIISRDWVFCCWLLSGKQNKKRKNGVDHRHARRWLAYSVCRGADLVASAIASTSRTRGSASTGGVACQQRNKQGKQISYFTACCCVSNQASGGSRECGRCHMRLHTRGSVKLLLFGGDRRLEEPYFTVPQDMSLLALQGYCCCCWRCVLRQWPYSDQFVDSFLADVMLFTRKHTTKKAMF